MRLNLERLQSIGKEWEAIISSYRIPPYTAPLNLQEEREKTLNAHLEGKSYDPQFNYKNSPEFPVNRLQKFMSILRPDCFLLEKEYYELARNALLQIRSIQTHAPADITGASSLIYGLPDQTLLADAWHILKTRNKMVDPTDEEMVSDEDTATYLRKIIEQIGLQEWQVKICDTMSASMAVYSLDKQIRIRRGSSFSMKDIHRLRVHEIGVHIFRYENARLQPLSIFKKFPGYLTTEEGLAVFSEAKAGLLQDSTLRKYAARVIAVNMALNEPFSKIFQTITPYVGPDLAFNIISRVKRGFPDTSQPGAHTKDIIYLRGFRAVQAHLARRPDDYEVLLAGKFGLQHLSLIRKLMDEGLIVKPRWLPDKLF